jgi:hypothetical protein
MDIGDAKALAAHADQEAANIQAGLSPTAAATRPWTDINTGPSVVSQPAAATAPAPRASDPYEPPATGGDPLTGAPAPNQPPLTGPNDPRIVREAGVPPPRDPVLTSPMQAPGPGAPIRVRDPYGNEFEMTQQQIDNRPGGSKDLTIIGPSPAPQAMTMASDNLHFAALEPFRMKQPQIDPLAAPQMDPMQGAGEMPAALTRTQVAATAPWLLPQDRLADLVGQYGEDVVFGYPGMPRSEVPA